VRKIFEEALNLVKSIHSSIEDGTEMRLFRVATIKQLNKPLVKVAFDTRRVNQNTDFNPRRNLQFYHRSEPFITEDLSSKLKTFFKLKIAVDGIKEEFVSDPDYLDSYCRILSLALDKTLRVDQKDFDFARPQMDYLEELLYLRYRLKPDDIQRFNEKELRDIVLNRDEKLVHKQIFAQYKTDNIKKNSQTEVKDTLIDKLFGETRATKENKNVKRSVTITIDDQIIEGKND
jgi:hypothetical protein